MTSSDARLRVTDAARWPAHRCRAATLDDGTASRSRSSCWSACSLLAALVAIVVATAAHPVHRRARRAGLLVGAFGPARGRSSCRSRPSSSCRPPAGPRLRGRLPAPLRRAPAVVRPGSLLLPSRASSSRRPSSPLVLHARDRPAARARVHRRRHGVRDGPGGGRRDVQAPAGVPTAAGDPRRRREPAQRRDGLVLFTIALAAADAPFGPRRRHARRSSARSSLSVAIGLVAGFVARAGSWRSSTTT